MAIIFAVVGGGAVGGVVIGGVISESYDDYGNYGNYGNYSNYSDAAERRKIRLAEKEKEIDSKKYEINSYKTNSVNEHLMTTSLKQQDGVRVSVSEVEKDGDANIQNKENMDIGRASSDIQLEKIQLDKVIKKIDKILQEDK